MTDTAVSPRSILRFGAFEFDARSRELRHHGFRVALADQPCEILIALIERPGENVTREELRQRIWASDTFVDFEHGLNAAVRRLREALGDSADAPRYVETVPRRGYRFVAQVLKESGQCVIVPPAGPARAARVSRRLTMVAASIVLTGIVVYAAAYLALDRRDILPWRANRGPGVQPMSLLPLTAMTGSEIFPTFSPDAGQVAFAWNGEKSDNWDIYVKFVGSSETRRVTTEPTIDTAPSWSPDGLRIAYLCGNPKPETLYPEGFMSVCLTSPLGGPSRRLCDFPAMTLPPSWTPDGRWLAVTRAASPTQPELAGVYLLPVEGGRPRHLALPMAPEGVLGPSISPDGRHLAFVSKHGAITFTVDVIGLLDDYVPDRHARRLTAPTFLHSVPAWSRDGRSLVYADQRAGATLWRVGLDGDAPPQRIDIAGRDAIWPQTTAGRDRLAFVRRLEDVGIYRVGHAGPSQPVLVSSGARDYNPDFSPDGRGLAFESDRAGGGPEIWLANADGSNAVQLTRGPGLSQGAPRWSPDGRRIAFDSRDASGQWDIWVIDADGASPRRVTHDRADEHGPSWSHDGRFLYFTSKRDGAGDIWRTHVDGGPAVRLTNQGGWLPLESPDGETLFYLRRLDDSPLVALPISGGPERVLVGCAAGDGFSVSRAGIHYISCWTGPPRLGRATPGRGSGSSLHLLDPVTGRSQVLAELEWAWVWGSPVTSPDGKTILAARWTLEGADLMMIDNFR